MDQHATKKTAAALASKLTSASVAAGFVHTKSVHRMLNALQTLPLTTMFIVD